MLREEQWVPPCTVMVCKHSAHLHFTENFCLHLPQGYWTIIFFPVVSFSRFGIKITRPL